MNPCDLGPRVSSEAKRQSSQDSGMRQNNFVRFLQEHGWFCMRGLTPVINAIQNEGYYILLVRLLFKFQL